jgi:hypothetical protein
VCRRLHTKPRDKREVEVEVEEELTPIIAWVGGETEAMVMPCWCM